MSRHALEVTINGLVHQAEVEARTSLADFLRESAGFTGVHLGCEHGVCGACTVIVEGRAVRSCLMLAVQANGQTITTAEGLAADDGSLHPVQQAMADEHALQCGFCTPGVVMTFAALTQSEPAPTCKQLTDAMSGHICRCTGYQGIKRVARRLSVDGAES